MKNQQFQLEEMSTSLPMTQDCIGDIRNIIVLARKSVVRHINSTMILSYWLIGRRIVEEEQKGRNRAAYGERLLERISRELASEFGNGFGEPHLRNCRLFYKTYPTEEEIRYALRIKLTWTHHRAIMRGSGNNLFTMGNFIYTEGVTPHPCISVISIRTSPISRRRFSLFRIPNDTTSFTGTAC